MKDLAAYIKASYTYDNGKLYYKGEEKRGKEDKNGYLMISLQRRRISYARAIYICTRKALYERGL